MFGLGIAWASGVAMFTFVLALSDKVIIIQTNSSFIEKQISNCVKNDIYQIEKMMFLEKLGRH